MDIQEDSVLAISCCLDSEDAMQLNAVIFGDFGQNMRMMHIQCVWSSLLF